MLLADVGVYGPRTGLLVSAHGALWEAVCADPAHSPRVAGDRRIVTLLVACPPVSGSCSFTLGSKWLTLETTDRA